MGPTAEFVKAAPKKQSIGIFVGPEGGFTEEEVFAALEQFGLQNKKEEVKLWYDGFVFGNKSDIYNPWSIINFLDNIPPMYVPVLSELYPITIPVPSDCT